MDHKKLSKFLSLLLRHNPQILNLNINQQGWVLVDEIITNAKSIKGYDISREEIEDVVKTSDKQRFSLSKDKIEIRANQGHSIDVNLGLEAQSEVPDILYHGTADKNLPSIMKKGVLSMDRQHVHLSSDIETAVKVGQRHGKVVILSIDIKAMKSTNQYEFFVSDNGVWLTKWVPPAFISIVEKD